MTITYGEITIIRNLEEETIYNFISRNFGNENTIKDNDNIIIQFDDNSMYDTKKDKNIDINIKFGGKHYEYGKPMYFDISNNTLFYKVPISNNEIIPCKRLNFKKIFSNYEKYDNSKCEPSIFNIIYYKVRDFLEEDLFSIVRIKSNEKKPRFLIAYDDKYFNKDEIIFLIDCLFKNKY